MSDLFEREAEFDALRAALADAAAGQGSLVLVEGAAGVGKSALLAELARAARANGTSVLSATGGELERDFPFGMVRQLLEPAVAAAGPDRRAQLFAGASAPAGPILGAVPEPEAPSADAGFATLHGLYWLVAALAEEQPLLIVFDDAHWADAPSLRFIDFLARRAADLPVLVAVGARPNEPGAEQALLAGIERQSVTVRPGLLSREGTAALIEANLGEVPAAAIDAAYEATGGNPLLTRELVRGLDPAELTEAAVRAAVPSSVTRSVSHRLAGLPDADRAVARALAVLGSAAGVPVIAGATDLGEDSVLDALDALRAVELIAGDPPEYAHPLLREAVTESVSRAERDRLHTEAARRLRSGDQDQLLMHLLAGSPLREQWAIDALRAGARRAVADGAPDAAVTRLRRAVEAGDGSPEPQLRLDLALALLSAADPQGALEELERVEASGDPLTAAMAAQAHVGAAILLGSGENAKLVALLRRTLDDLPPDAPPALLTEMRGNLLNALTLDTRLSDDYQQTLAEMSELPPTSHFSAHLGWEAACGHATAAEVTELCAAALEPRPFTDLQHVERGTNLWAVTALLVVDGRDLSDIALTDAETTARHTGSRLGRAFAANMRGEWNLMFGSIAQAEADAHQALEIWQETGLAIMINTCRGTLASALVLIDRLDEAAEVLAPAVMDETSYTTCILLAGRAQLHLARNEPEAALADHEMNQRIASALGWRRFARGMVGPEHALALALTGRTDEGRAMAEEERAFAERTGRLTLEATALATLGMIEGGAKGIAHLRAATVAADRSASPITRARAQIELGAALRREGYRTEARPLLREGGELATRLGARLLQTRASEELAIAGARQRDPFSSGVDSLTPSERRVAEHAARGLTNREIAETLFVTQKTVEVHLGKTYAKLEIRSRNQLAEALGGRTPAAAAT